MSVVVVKYSESITTTITVYTDIKVLKRYIDIYGGSTTFAAEQTAIDLKGEFVSLGKNTSCLQKVL